jgi:hypothetical protein
MPLHLSGILCCKIDFEVKKLELTRANLAAKVVTTTLIFITLLVMGMQFTVHHFTSKQSITFPIIILSVVLIYHVLFDRKIISNKNNVIVLGSLLLFTLLCLKHQ